MYSLKVVGECDPDKTGTKVTFLPDGEIFEETVFEYDVLNLYGLNQFGFSNGVQAEIMVRGYDGVTEALTEGTMTEDVAVVAFGKVAGVSSLNNSDPKSYIR